MSDDVLRCGIDGFAAYLLERVRGITLPVTRSPLSRGRPAGWLMGPGELIPFMSPVSGSVARINKKVQAAPELITGSPYDDGWLLEVRSSGPVGDIPGLLSSDQIGKRTNEQLEDIAGHLKEYLGQDETVGPTLQDGGEHLAGLRRILGPARYRELLLSVLA